MKATVFVTVVTLFILQIPSFASARERQAPRQTSYILGEVPTDSLAPNPEESADDEDDFRAKLNASTSVATILRNSWGGADEYKDLYVIPRKDRETTVYIPVPFTGGYRQPLRKELFIDPEEEANYTYAYVRALEQQKWTLMHLYHLSNRRYNKLAVLAFGFLRNESTFAQSPVYELKERFPLLVVTLKRLQGRKNPEDLSCGPTQMKDIPELIVKYYQADCEKIYKPDFGAAATVGKLAEFIDEIHGRITNHPELKNCIDEYNIYDYLPVAYQFGTGRVSCDNHITDNSYIAEMKEHMQRLTLLEGEPIPGALDSDEKVFNEFMAKKEGNFAALQDKKPAPAPVVMAPQTPPASSVRIKTPVPTFKLVARTATKIPPKMTPKKDSGRITVAAAVNPAPRPQKTQAAAPVVRRAPPVTAIATTPTRRRSAVGRMLHSFLDADQKPAPESCTPIHSYYAAQNKECPPTGNN